MKFLGLDRWRGTPSKRPPKDEILLYADRDGGLHTIDHSGETHNVGGSGSGDGEVLPLPVQTGNFNPADYNSSMGYDTNGVVDAVQLAIPAGTYTGITIPAQNPNGTDPIDDEIFIGVYSEDGSELLAQTADIHEQIEPLSEPTLLSVEFIDPLILSEPGIVWIGVLLKNGNAYLGYVSANYWTSPLTISDSIQTDLTTLPDHLNVNIKDQFVNIAGASEGQFELIIEPSSEITDPISWNATALDVQTILETIVGSGNVIVTLNNQLYKIRFLSINNYISNYDSDTLDVTPTIDNPSQNNYYWMIRVEGEPTGPASGWSLRGPMGVSGPQGEQGPSGTQGEPGIQGDTGPRGGQPSDGAYIACIDETFNDQIGDTGTVSEEEVCRISFWKDPEEDVRISWNLWVSQSNSGGGKGLTYRLRRGSLSGTILSTHSSSPSSDVINGHQDQWISSVIDDTPGTTPVYILTVQGVHPGPAQPNQQLWSDTRQLQAATGIVGPKGDTGDTGPAGEDASPDFDGVILPGTTAQNYVSGARIPVNWGTASLDPDGYWNSGDPSKITVDAKEVWEFEWALVFGASDPSASYVTAGLSVNGSGSLKGEMNMGPTGGPNYMWSGTRVALNPGDHVQIAAGAGEAIDFQGIQFSGRAVGIWS